MAKARTRKASQTTTTVTPSAAPGTKDKAAAETEEEKEKKTRAVYIDTLSEKQKADPDVYPFSATPEDFDFDAFKELKKKDFVAEHQWYTHRSDACMHKATKFQEQAEASKSKGSKKDRATIKRVTKMQATMIKLQKLLESQGQDVDSIMAQARADAEAAVKAEAEKAE